MKFVPAFAAAAMLAAAAPVSAEPLYRVDDPTGSQFSGSYDCSYYTYDEQGNATKTSKTCSQTGYVAVYEDGVVACNGNEKVTRPDDGSPLQGYVWVGPAHRPTGEISGEAPGGAAGAGNSLTADDQGTKDKNEAHGPCED